MSDQPETPISSGSEAAPSNGNAPATPSANGNGATKALPTMTYAFQLMKVSWKAAKEMQRLNRRIQESYVAQDEEALFAAMTDFQALAAPRIKYIPPEAKAEDAPPDLDWSTPEALEYLDHRAMQELVDYFAGLRTLAVENAKNLPSSSTSQK